MNPAEPTPFQITTLIIAVVGVVLSLGSLTWQVVQFSLTGYRVRVQLKIGALGRGGVASGRFSGDLEVVMSQGFQTPVVIVEATNVGRSPVTIREYSIELGNGFAYSEPGIPGSATVPHRLEPGEHAAFFASMDAVAQASQVTYESNLKAPQRVRARVALSTGKAITGAWAALRPEMLPHAGPQHP